MEEVCAAEISERHCCQVRLVGGGVVVRRGALGISWVRLVGGFVRGGSCAEMRRGEKVGEMELAENLLLGIVG